MLARVPGPLFGAIVSSPRWLLAISEANGQTQAWGACGNIWLDADAIIRHDKDDLLRVRARRDLHTPTTSPAHASQALSRRFTSAPPPKANTRPVATPTPSTRLSVASSRSRASRMRGEDTTFAPAE
jgi:hypothetical protein